MTTQPRTHTATRSGALHAPTRREIANHCNGCNQTWTGLAPAHCAACHRTFTGFSAFDKHRTGSHAHGTRHCLHPASVGLVPVTRPYWSGWGNPGERPPQ